MSKSSASATPPPLGPPPPHPRAQRAECVSQALLHTVRSFHMHATGCCLHQAQMVNASCNLLSRTTTPFPCPRWAQATKPCDQDTRDGTEVPIWRDSSPCAGQLPPAPPQQACGSGRPTREHGPWSQRTPETGPAHCHRPQCLCSPGLPLGLPPGLQSGPSRTQVPAAQTCMHTITWASSLGGLLYSRWILTSEARSDSMTGWAWSCRACRAL